MLHAPAPCRTIAHGKKQRAPGTNARRLCPSSLVALLETRQNCSSRQPCSPPPTSSRADTGLLRFYKSWYTAAPATPPDLLRAVLSQGRATRFAQRCDPPPHDKSPFSLHALNL
ncbi:uncharacterized protein BKA78DRAFT_315931 [Phyllosticta capitalensis]|uniref:uncharacterized protein n=1 Tax=Phyllosticta capitalensis TaxID=121624 RepID=UPI00312D5C9E